MTVADHGAPESHPSVILINVFEVPQGRDREFLAGWERTAEFMRRQEGFRSTRLHGSLNGEAQFRYVNVAEWVSPAAFQQAVGQDAFRAAARDIAFAQAHPSLYRVGA